MNIEIVQNLVDLLGKPSCPLDVCLKILEGDYSTRQKREAISSIGRKRDEGNKPILFQYSENGNPEIAIQAIRGLLPFKKDNDVLELLGRLVTHPNDMIRDIAEVELNGIRKPDANHAKSSDHLKNVLVDGDVKKIVELLPDEAVHLTFTSPPYYNARDYSIYSTYSEYLDFLEEVFEKVQRVTKEGRFFVLNTSPVIMPRAGRKYSSRRYPVPFDIHARLMMMGWEFIDDIIWKKPEKSAKNRISNFNVHRKPLTYKPNSCTEYVMVYRKKTHRLIDWNLKQYESETVESSLVDDSFERSNIWEIAPVFSKRHSAVFPVELCKQVIKLYSFRNDLVFDPFAGSGTVGVASIALGRNYLLTELCKDYMDSIEQRLRGDLFSECKRFNVSEFEKSVKNNEYC